MIQKIKEILKYFLPPPVHAFNREVNRIIDMINSQNQNMEWRQKEIDNNLTTLDNHVKEMMVVLEKQNALLLNAFRDLKVIITDNESTVCDRFEALEKEFSGYMLVQKKVVRNQSNLEEKFNEEIKQRKTGFDNLNQRIEDLFVNIERYADVQANKFTGIGDTVAQNQISLEEKFNEEIKQRKTGFDNLNQRIEDLFVNIERYADVQANKFTGIGDTVAQNQISLEEKFNEEIKQRKTGFDNLDQKIADLFVKIQRYGDTQEKKISTLEEEVKRQRELIKVSSDKLARVSDGLNDDNIKNIEQLADIRNTSLVMGRDISEAVWAEIYNSTITKSRWLKDKAFSPGRWAVGYPYLYVIYRILNEVQPQNILELGLGQSTKMIGQYTSYYKGVHHQVVEHDPEWIDFFKKNYSLSERTKLIQLNREFVSYKEAEKVRVFKDFYQTFKGQKFDFISIDAPLGGDMKEYARIDVLQMIPTCLAEDFIIMIDDCERSGEAHTVMEMERVLQENQILYKKGKYSGKKDCIVIASNALKFVCSM